MQLPRLPSTFYDLGDNCKLSDRHWHLATKMRSITKKDAFSAKKQKILLE